METIGILFAIAALISWGFGDFFIQKSTRKVGVVHALFFIGVLALTLTPFVWNEFINILQNSPDKVVFLAITVLIVFVAALLNFEGLKIGKIAVVEPILSAELPITIGLAIFVWSESVNVWQILLSAMIFLGIILAATANPKHFGHRKHFFEKGVAFAALGTIGMGITNFLTGVSAQNTSPLLTIWFIHSGLAVLCLIYLLAKGEIEKLFTNLIKFPGVILAESVFDNAAWIFFAFAATMIPISVATTLGEGYIALAVLLGIFVNKEKVNTHQKIGITLAIVGVIALSVITA